MKCPCLLYCGQLEIEVTAVSVVDVLQVLVLSVGVSDGVDVVLQHKTSDHGC